MCLCLINMKGHHLPDSKGRRAMIGRVWRTRRGLRGVLETIDRQEIYPDRVEPWNAPVESGDQSKMPYPAFSPPARTLIVAGACALVVMLIRAAEPILAPILLAVFIAMVAHPALLWMRRRGMPKWGALAVIAFILLDVGGLLALMTTGLLEKFKSRLPAYQEKFLLLSDQFGQWAEGVGSAAHAWDCRT